LPIVPPEVFFGMPYSKHGDIFSFGLILNEMYSHVEAWTQNNAEQIKSLLLLGARPPIARECPESLRRLIESCWSQDPLDRPSSFEEIAECLILVKRKFFESHQQTRKEIEHQCIELDPESSISNRYLEDDQLMLLSNAEVIPEETSKTEDKEKNENENEEEEEEEMIIDNKSNQYHNGNDRDSEKDDKELIHRQGVDLCRKL